MPPKGFKKQFCFRGHDLSIEGRSNDGHCIICIKDKNHSTIVKDLRIKAFCPKGHDKDIVGRYKNGQCKLCVDITTKQWMIDNPDKMKLALRKSHWKRAGIINSDGTPFINIDYDRAYQIQQGRCANKSCNLHQSELNKVFHVDHDHSTGIFRGLLCSSCNHLLGMAKDSVNILSGAIEYLKKHN